MARIDDDDDAEDADDFHGETTAVKGEYSWPAQSSSDSMRNEIDVTTLLAQHAPRHLESPEPFEDDILPQNSPPDLAPHQSSRPGTEQRQRVASTMEDRLMVMPQLRELPWREGIRAGAENETGGESRRKQIRFGCLLATRGEIQQNPCLSCANGRGKFSVCVALDGFFKGACASCQLSGRPNRCSIKKNEVGEIAESPTLNPPLPEEPSPFVDHGHPPEAKRRKTDAVPEWESARPQWEQELGESHARQQMNEIVQRPWPTVNNSPASMPIQHAMMNGMNGSGSRPPEGAHPPRDSLGWASVNQPVPMPGQTYRNSADGQSFRVLAEQGRREDTGNDDGLTLIDTLPKSKQRQVYGLISGIQGGIFTLQRELDSLKRALGIDDET
ncbi:hypothetical protein LZ554_002132 [Drepanopeziza brunnea f. sp. 'monogermtubi']|nr:hypothetical protein LZ554_002132 [Drepanopeziza brunnea f. sp. 'monogermtubi']